MFCKITVSPESVNTVLIVVARGGWVSPAKKFLELSTANKTFHPRQNKSDLWCPDISSTWHFVYSIQRSYLALPKPRKVPTRTANLAGSHFLTELSSYRKVDLCLSAKCLVDQTT